MKSLYVANAVKVGDFLEIKLAGGENLLLRQEKTIKEFIKKYNKYFYSNDVKDIKEFYNLTGLFLTHVYHVPYIDNMLVKITITANGIFAEQKNERIPTIYNEHLCVLESGNHFNIVNEKVMLDDIVICEVDQLNNNAYLKNVEAKRNFEKLKFYKDSIPSIKILKEQGFLVPNQVITYMTIDLFHNIISLTKNGNLYINNDLYASNVEHIIEFNSTDIYFVYKNNWVEHYCSTYVEYNRVQQYDKVLYGYNYLVTLREKTVTVYFFVAMSYQSSLIDDETFDMTFYEVDDIAIEVDDGLDRLRLYKNKESILMPLIGICKLS